MVLGAAGMVLGAGWLGAGVVLGRVIYLFFALSPVSYLLCPISCVLSPVSYLLALH